MHALPDVQAAAHRVRDALPQTPEVLLVLGSGLGHLADAIDDPVQIAFTELPGFPEPGVAGHAGRYVAGRLTA